MFHKYLGVQSTFSTKKFQVSHFEHPFHLARLKDRAKKKSTGTLHCKRHAPEVSTWINKSLHTVLVFFLMNKNCQIIPSITV